MVFFEDFLDMLDDLPEELHNKYVEIRAIDLECTMLEASFKENNDEFLSNLAAMSAEQKSREMERVFNECALIESRVDKKVEIATRLAGLLLKYLHRLEKERLHFKHELETDNPGITTQIESKFAEQISAMHAARKERRKRRKTSSLSLTPPLGGSAAAAPQQTASVLPQLFPGADNFLADNLYSFDEQTLYAGWSSPKSRRDSTSSFTFDESSPSAPRRRTSFTKSSSSMAQSLTGASSPSHSERSWSPGTSSRGSPPSFFATGNSPQPFQLAMPNFTGPESRHGRQRKLTPRVQEMFKDTYQRQRAHHHPPETFEQGPIEDYGEDEHHVSSEESSNASDVVEETELDTKKTWCICKQKSYGNMVACDNEDCPYEWFHYHCVGISAPPRGRWFCSYCTDSLNLLPPAPPDFDLGY